MTVALADLLIAAELEAPTGSELIDVSDIAYDSRRITPGTLFVAVPGFHVDGHDFIDAAIAQGAVAVVAQRMPPTPPPARLPVILTDDSRAALSRLAAAFVGHPSRRMTVAGITGTDGKTTTTTMLWAAWQRAGIHAGALTTVDFRSGDVVTENTTRQTTLEAVELQQQLEQMRRQGCTSIALETSSHALELRRADAVNYRAAVFTRITSEHLELHGNRDAYLAAKARLLELAARHPDGIAVLDCDDDFAHPKLVAMPIGRRLGYSASGAASADLVAGQIRADQRGVSFQADTPWGTAEVHLQLAGRFNVANALAAIAAACATGASLEQAVAGIGDLDRVGGRMERVQLGQPFDVIIDYAHTAEALEKVLGELRTTTAGRLWVVFGSAGERDRDKRPAMGRVAATYADVAIITDEDPREEDRDRILEEIAAGAREAGGRMQETVLIIPDRLAAISQAIGGAAAGDTVLLAGKGHESSIIMGRTPVPYSERATAEAAVRDRLAAEPVG